jgi:hypothetical protein
VLHQARGTRILAEQADRMAEHYKDEAEVRELGGGDLVEQ